MFNFTRGEPVAMIEGGKESGRVLHILPDGEYDENIKNVYGSVEIEKGVFVPLPSIEENQVEVLFISAPQGVGKTTFVNNYINTLHEIDEADGSEKRLVLLFSSKDYDPSLDIKHVKIDVRDLSVKKGVVFYGEDEFDVNAFENTIFLFDDVDTLKGDQGKAVFNILDTVIQTGRQNANMTIYVNHVLKNYQKTKIVRVEATKVVIFPKGGNVSHVATFLKDDLGYDNDQIKEILKTDSRWVLIKKSYPQYVLTSKECYVPSSKWLN